MVNFCRNLVKLAQYLGYRPNRALWHAKQIPLSNPDELWNWMYEMRGKWLSYQTEHAQDSMLPKRLLKLQKTETRKACARLFAKPDCIGGQHALSGLQVLCKFGFEDIAPASWLTFEQISKTRNHEFSVLRYLINCGKLDMISDLKHYDSIIPGLGNYLAAQSMERHGATFEGEFIQKVRQKTEQALLDTPWENLQPNGEWAVI